MISNIELMIPPPKKWKPDHYCISQNQMAVDESSISEISYSIRKFSALVDNATKEQFEKEMRLHMTDSEIIIRRRVDDALWNFHREHYDIKLKLVSSNQDHLALQGYSTLDVLTIEMEDAQKQISRSIPFCELYEDWHGPDKLSRLLEWMYKNLKGD